MGAKLHACDLPPQVIMDCEYNKHLGQGKIIRWPNEKGEKTIRPDLVFHQRNNDDKNLMIVEFKGYWNSDLDDLKKLKALSLEKERGGYGYKLGVFVRLGLQAPEYLYFQNGKKKLGRKIEATT